MYVCIYIYIILRRPASLHDSRSGVGLALTTAAPGATRDPGSSSRVGRLSRGELGVFLCLVCLVSPLLPVPSVCPGYSS